METAKMGKTEQPIVPTAEPKPDMKAAALKAWITRRANLANVAKTETEPTKVEQPAKTEKKPRKSRAAKKAKE